MAYFDDKICGIMPDFSLIVQGLALGLTAAASPGPFQTYLVNQTLNKGWQRSFQVAFAPLISDIPIVLVVLLVLDRLPAQFLRVVSLVGGIFVLYLSYSLLRQWLKPAGVESKEAQAPQENSPEGTKGRLAQSAFLRGVLMNSLSPGPYTFWTLVSGPIVLAALRQSWFLGASFILGFYAAMIGGCVAIVMLFHQARSLGPRVVRILILVSILILAAFGGIVLVRGIRG